MKTILIELDEDLHHALKTKCLEQRSTIKETLLSLIKNFTHKGYAKK